jgi:hypothetical protein
MLLAYEIAAVDVIIVFNWSVIAPIHQKRCSLSFSFWHVVRDLCFSVLCRASAEKAITTLNESLWKEVPYKFHLLVLLLRRYILLLVYFLLPSPNYVDLVR